jgi:hypothetical protein
MASLFFMFFFLYKEKPLFQKKMARTKKKPGGTDTNTRKRAPPDPIRLAACAARYRVPKCNKNTRGCALKHAARDWRIEQCLSVQYEPYFRQHFRKKHWPDALEAMGLDRNLKMPIRYRRKSRRPLRKPRKKVEEEVATGGGNESGPSAGGGNTGSGRSSKSHSLSRSRSPSYRSSSGPSAGGGNTGSGRSSRVSSKSRPSDVSVVLDENEIEQAMLRVDEPLESNTLIQMALASSSPIQELRGRSISSGGNKKSKSSSWGNSGWSRPRSLSWAKWPSSDLQKRFRANTSRGRPIIKTRGQLFFGSNLASSRRPPYLFVDSVPSAHTLASSTSWDKNETSSAAARVPSAQSSRVPSRLPMIDAMVAEVGKKATEDAVAEVIQETENVSSAMARAASKELVREARRQTSWPIRKPRGPLYFGSNSRQKDDVAKVAATLVQEEGILPEAAVALAVQAENVVSGGSKSSSARQRGLSAEAELAATLAAQMQSKSSSSTARSSQEPEGTTTTVPELVNVLGGMLPTIEYVAETMEVENDMPKGDAVEEATAVVIEEMIDYFADIIQSSQQIARPAALDEATVKVLQKMADEDETPVANTTSRSNSSRLKKQAEARQNSRKSASSSHRSRAGNSATMQGEGETATTQRLSAASSRTPPNAAQTKKVKREVANLQSNWRNPSPRKGTRAATAAARTERAATESVATERAATESERAATERATTVRAATNRAQRAERNEKIKQDLGLGPSTLTKRARKMTSKNNPSYVDVNAMVALANIPIRFDPSAATRKVAGRRRSNGGSVRSARVERRAGLSLSGSRMKRAKTVSRRVVEQWKKEKQEKQLDDWLRRRNEREVIVPKADYSLAKKQLNKHFEELDRLQDFNKVIRVQLDGGRLGRMLRKAKLKPREDFLKELERRDRKRLRDLKIMYKNEKKTLGQKKGKTLTMSEYKEKNNRPLTRMQKRMLEGTIDNNDGLDPTPVPRYEAATPEEATGTVDNDGNRREPQKSPIKVGKTPVRIKVERFNAMRDKGKQQNLKVPR